MRCSLFRGTFQKFSMFLSFHCVCGSKKCQIFSGSRYFHALPKILFLIEMTQNEKGLPHTHTLIVVLGPTGVCFCADKESISLNMLLHSHQLINRAGSLSRASEYITITWQLSR